MAPKEANLANELDPSLNFIACDIMVCTHKESQLTRINVLYPNGGMYWFTSFLLYTSHVHHQQVFYEIFHYKISLILGIVRKYIYTIYLSNLKDWRNYVRAVFI